MKRFDKRGVGASEGLIGLLMILLSITLVGLAIGMIVRGAAEANGGAVNETILSNYDTYNETESTLSSMKEKFIDDEGNARTGITDIINTLFTGVGGVITVIFQVPISFIKVIAQVGSSLFFGGASTAAVTNVGIFFFVAIAIITTIYMITRRT